MAHEWHVKSAPPPKKGTRKKEKNCTYKNIYTPPSCCSETDLSLSLPCTTHSTGQAEQDVWWYVLAVRTSEVHVTVGDWPKLPMVWVDWTGTVTWPLLFVFLPACSCCYCWCCCRLGSSWLAIPAHELDSLVIAPLFLPIHAGNSYPHPSLLFIHHACPPYLFSFTFVSLLLSARAFLALLLLYSTHLL